MADAMKTIRTTDAVIWVRKLGPFTIGRTDALDEGWMTDNSLRRFGPIRLSCGIAHGVGFVAGKRLYSAWIMARKPLSSVAMRRRIGVCDSGKCEGRIA